MRSTFQQLVDRYKKEEMAVRESLTAFQASLSDESRKRVKESVIGLGISAAKVAYLIAKSWLHKLGAKTDEKWRKRAEEIGKVFEKHSDLMRSNWTMSLVEEGVDICNFVDAFCPWNNIDGQLDKQKKLVEESAGLRRQMLVVVRTMFEEGVIQELLEVFRNGGI